MASTQLVSRARVKQLRILGLTENYSSVRIPYAHFVTFIAVRNRTANAVTGGLNIGTADDGQEVIDKLTVGASALIHVDDDAILKRVFSMSAATRLYVHAETSWNSAELDIYIGLEKLQP